MRPAALLQVGLVVVAVLGCCAALGDSTWEDCGSELATIQGAEPYSYSQGHGYVRFGFLPKDPLPGRLRALTLTTARNGTLLPRVEYDMCDLARGCPLPAEQLVHLVEYTTEVNKIRFIMTQNQVVVVCLDVDLDRATDEDPPPSDNDPLRAIQVEAARDGYKPARQWRDCGSSRTQPQSVLVRGDSVRISFHMQAAIEDPSPMELKARGETLQRNLCEMTQYGLPRCPVPPQSVLLQLPLPPKPPLYARNPMIDDEDYEWSRFIAWEKRRHGTVILCVEFTDA